ncbi:MAG: radical SAM protein [Proteobacteria bacterium]|nr:MAG: radical SAM protein [Pseudomonadota bacterium]
MAASRAMMAFADAEGRVYEHPELELVGWDGECWRPVDERELRPMPEGSDLFLLPGRQAAGFDRQADEVAILDEPGTSAVSCFIAPAYLRTLMPAYAALDDAPALPLFAYSAVGLRDGELVVPTLRVDEDIRQDPFRFDIDVIADKVEARCAAYGDNRLVQHLRRCALDYHCRAAQNYFLDRFEAPLPAAPTCNALCVGCISLQPKGGDEQAVAAHDRIGFAPTSEELAQVALGHIERVGADAVVSFGQGCEGEPLSQGSRLVEAVRRIRAKTDLGVVNLNSNASRPGYVRALCDAGLDSLRISTNSARDNVYRAYYRPKGYRFEDVRESARVARDAGIYLMLNYFVFPGVTDTEAELDALSAWIEDAGVDMIQLRNLNIDPELYLETVAAARGLGEPMGLLPWLERLRERHPRLAFGYFNPPRRRMNAA